MAATYHLQRQDLVGHLPLTAPEISDEWPYLVKPKWMIQHLSRLLGINVLERLSQGLSAKKQSLLNYFQTQASSMKELGRRLTATDIVSESPAALLPLLMVYFGEDEAVLFCQSEVNKTLVCFLPLVTKQFYSLYLYFTLIVYWKWPFIFTTVLGVLCSIGIMWQSICCCLWRSCMLYSLTVVSVVSCLLTEFTTHCRSWELGCWHGFTRYTLCGVSRYVVIIMCHFPHSVWAGSGWHETCSASEYRARYGPTIGHCAGNGRVRHGAANRWIHTGSSPCLCDACYWR